MSSPTPPSSATPPPVSNPNPPPAANPALTLPIPSLSPSSSSVASSSGQPGPPPPKPPLEPLTGFRAALEHTGLPRSVLTYKPRLPSTKWLIFWSVLGSVSYIYYDDRRKAKNIKAEYIEKVKHFGKEVVPGGSLGMVRTVKVLAARWPEDDDADRGARYFRKYLKPYLVAAGIDYEQMPPPLYGAIARQTHAAILKKRRQKLGLEADPIPLSLPGALDPGAIDANELEGGVVLIGRPSLKEYLEGLKRGWSGGVDPWVWEEEVKGKLKDDGVFESPVEEALQEAGSSGNQASAVSDSTSNASDPSLSLSSPLPTGLGFLSRPQSPIFTSPSSQTTSSSAAASIPSHFHIPPSPLPPQPPLLLVPWTNHLGFQQIPYMIWDFFTEHKRVEEGAKLAYALICGHSRPFVGPAFSSANPPPSTSPSTSDLDFDLPVEKYFKNDFDDLPSRLEKARTTYYPDLTARLADIRSLAKGERELTDAEKKSTKPLPTEEDLQAERLKKEMLWRGQVEGWGIVRKEQAPAWVEGWEGWLKVFRAPEKGEEESKDNVNWA